MDQTKIAKLLRLMKLLTGNVSRTIDQLAREMGITPQPVITQAPWADSANTGRVHPARRGDCQCNQLPERR